jgi:hypothetical protein
MNGWRSTIKRIHTEKYCFGKTLVTKRRDLLVGFLLMRNQETKKVAKSKYAKYLIPAPIRIDGKFKEKPHPMLFQMGQECWKGANFCTDWHYVTQPAIIREKPHKHSYDCYFCFVGGDPSNITDFQGEVWMYLGDEHEQEKFVITSPTSIWVPAGMVHCPFIIKKVIKPIFYIGYAITSLDEVKPTDEVIFTPKVSQLDQ